MQTTTTWVKEVQLSVAALILGSCSSDGRATGPLSQLFRSLLVRQRHLALIGPVDLYVPDGYDCADTAPLVLMLHGYPSLVPQILDFFYAHPKR
jgi:hypothetical protein